MKWITAIHWSVNECKSQLLHQNTVGWHSFSIFRCFTFSTQWFFGRSSLHIAIWAVTPSLRFVTSNNNNTGRAKKKCHSQSAESFTKCTHNNNSNSKNGSAGERNNIAHASDQLYLMVMKSNMINISHLLSCHSCVIYFAFCSAFSRRSVPFVPVRLIHILCEVFVVWVSERVSVFVSPTVQFQRRRIRLDLSWLERVDIEDMIK